MFDDHLATADQLSVIVCCLWWVEVHKHAI